MSVSDLAGLSFEWSDMDDDDDSRHQPKLLKNIKIYNNKWTERVGKYKEVMDLHKDGVPVETIAGTLNVSPRTVYDWLEGKFDPRNVGGRPPLISPSGMLNVEYTIEERVRKGERVSMDDLVRIMQSQHQHEYPELTAPSGERVKQFIYHLRVTRCTTLTASRPHHSQTVEERKVVRANVLRDWLNRLKHLFWSCHMPEWPKGTIPARHYITLDEVTIGTLTHDKGSRARSVTIKGLPVASSTTTKKKEARKVRSRKKKAMMQDVWRGVCDRISTEFNTPVDSLEKFLKPCKRNHPAKEETAAELGSAWEAFMRRQLENKQTTAVSTIDPRGNKRRKSRKRSARGEDAPATPAFLQESLPEFEEAVSKVPVARINPHEGREHKKSRLIMEADEDDTVWLGIR